MSSLDDIIGSEVKKVIKEAVSEEDLAPTPLERLDDALKELANKGDALEALFAPYLVFRDIFKLATAGLKLILNDVVFIVKDALAIRPSSWKAAKEGHTKRAAKLNKDWDAAMTATGADSSAASLISFLAFPGPIAAAAVVDQGITTVAHINHALIDSGIRLPFVSTIVPGATPPEELDMDEKELKQKKRGELSTKDAVKIALMKLFFAHHAPSGKILSEEKDKPLPNVKVTPAAVTKHFKDIGVYDKAQEDLQSLFDAKMKSIEKFFDAEKPIEKVEQATKLLKADTPEKFIKAAKEIDDPEMSKAADEYIKAFKKSAEKVANNKKFQNTASQNLDTSNLEEAEKEEASKEEVKKEAIVSVYAKTHPEFSEAMSESLEKYIRWIVESVESIYQVKKSDLRNPIVKKAYDEKNEILEKLIGNISLI